LPHDWAISGPYDPQGEYRTGKLPWRGEGWYRKSFSLPASDAGRRIYLDFDGVMAMPTVYVNGRKAGGWDYGYVSFRVDVTDYVKPGQPNMVAVHVDTPVYVYTSGDAAELFLNGQSFGRRAKNPNAEVVRDRYALRWLDVPYQAGELKVVAHQNGRVLGAAIMRTAGEPAKLRLTPDRTSLKADGEDLTYVLVEAVDKDNNPCPLAMNDVTFHLAGPATLAGVGNGDHHFPAEFVTDRVALFYGKAMLIVRTSEGQGGGIRVTAKSEGLVDATATMESGA
jgi:hypothetical protein